MNEEYGSAHTAMVKSSQSFQSSFTSVLHRRPTNVSRQDWSKTLDL